MILSPRIARHPFDVQPRCHDRKTRIQPLSRVDKRFGGAGFPRPGRLYPVAPCAMLPPMSAKEAAACLKTSPIFTVLPAREIEALGAVTVEEPHRARDFIFMEGDPARWF